MMPTPHDEAEGTPQPPPPETTSDAPGSGSPSSSRTHPHEPSAIDLLHAQLVDVRELLGRLTEEAESDRLRRKHEYVPVRASDLMRGFQAAVARANRAVVAGELDGQDIEDMAIRDLRISISAPIIDGGHAEDPTLMLPNIKSVDDETARLSLEFSVATVPLTKTKG